MSTRRCPLLPWQKMSGRYPRAGRLMEKELSGEMWQEFKELCVVVNILYFLFAFCSETYKKSKQFSWLQARTVNLMNTKYIDNPNTFSVMVCTSRYAGSVSHLKEICR